MIGMKSYGQITEALSEVIVTTTLITTRGQKSWVITRES